MRLRRHPRLCSEEAWIPDPSTTPGARADLVSLNAPSHVHLAYRPGVRCGTMHSQLAAGLADLQKMLTLYDLPRSSGARRQIAGIVGLALVALDSLLTLLGPLLVRRGLDSGVNDGDMTVVWVASAIFFVAGLLSAGSQLGSSWLARRIGLVNTMVFTHLPANLMLMSIPFMPTAEAAVAVVLIRAAITQMDVPVRQSYTMAVVAPELNELYRLDVERYREQALTLQGQADLYRVQARAFEEAQQTLASAWSQADAERSAYDRVVIDGTIAAVEGTTTGRHRTLHLRIPGREPVGSRRSNSAFVAAWRNLSISSLMSASLAM